MKKNIFTLALLLATVAGNAQTSCPDGNHPHMIDLGLPSGTKWACCNVGASKPEGYGGYYSWGEIITKNKYDWSTYPYADGHGECMDIGYDDNIAGTEYDVANAKWGDIWKMPSIEHIHELVFECTRTWKTINGVNGILVKGPNGNTIFMPAAGSRPSSNNVGKNGFYWSSVRHEHSRAYGLEFSSREWNWNKTNSEYLGHPVRAVSLSEKACFTNSIQAISDSESTSSTLPTTLSANTHSCRKCPDEHHPHRIDLGLPSATKWACCNVGASKPEDYGGYYAWGETEEKSVYNQVTYQHCSGVDEDSNGYYDYNNETGTYGIYHKIGRNIYQYCYLTDKDGDGSFTDYVGADFYGIDEDGDGVFDDYKGNDINKYISEIKENESCDDYYGDDVPLRIWKCIKRGDIAGTKYDVSHVKWGGSWSMPSEEQLEELLINCLWRKTTQNGVKGYLVMGTNGGVIFMPIAGRRVNDNTYDIYLNDEEYSAGYYWSSMFIDSDIEGGAGCLEGRSLRNLAPYYGFSVRAVCP